VGLVITSTLSLCVNVQWAIRQSAEAENQMTAVERALEYTKLEPEAPFESSAG
jgi:ATP-binding cassette subfamily C (CFTR/MRP) protein 4